MKQPGLCIRTVCSEGSRLCFLCGETLGYLIFPVFQCSHNYVKHPCVLVTVSMIE